MTPLLLAALVAFQLPDSGQAIASRVEIVRTEYGVPHIFAEDLAAMGFAMAWVQSEDYGAQVAIGLVQQRGEYARHVGRDSIGGDFVAREAHARAVETFHRLDPSTREVYRGFAEGLNHYIRLHRDDFPEWMEPDFRAVDAHAADIQSWSRGDAASFVRRLERRQQEASEASASDGPEEEGRSLPTSWETEVRRAEAVDPEVDGSNAWALHGSRTASGNTILLRNPHLSWSAGYYEAHVRVPGVLEFYGDFRIGGAFGIIGGFNRHLGWATTNNSPRYSQVYALERHPRHSGSAMLDGEPVPLDERTISVDFLTEDGGVDVETETTSWTPFGPVIHETEDQIYVLKDPRDGEFRRGEQFLKMMMATDLQEWLAVMRMRAHPSSNFTYADAGGNIALYYNARIPLLPHSPTGDTAAVARSRSDIWSELVPWESLPLYLNPPGGYVQQANDTPHYINLNVRLGSDTVPANLPEPRLRLRSQLSFDLIHGDDVLTMDDVIRRKHSPRMLAAERTLDDLLEIVRASQGARDLQEASDVLAAWDRTAAVDSRGGVLFARWFDAYTDLADTVWAQEWSEDRPTETPTGVGSPRRAVQALYHVVGDLRAAGIPLDVPWGEIHRVIRGDVDEPVAGCEGGMGCFRTLSFEETGDGRMAANRGDGWIFVVELGGPAPEARTVLAYGQSAREESPHYDDQAAMFARGEMKTVRWTDDEIEAATIRRYRPGQEARR
ncbi:MAG: penicillin acylase family protein [Longimicrobiales bacterium]|nr:penicillin acylase family protein [Longimicrobiales bacterium]